QYSILLPILIIAIGGIGLPGGAVYINTLLLRRRVYGALVAAGGAPGAPLVPRLPLVLIYSAFQPGAPHPVLYAAFAFLALLHLTALLFNLLPCPGLDGWGIVAPFLPGKTRNWGRRTAPIAPIILVVGLFLIPGLNGWFWDVVYGACALIGLDPRVALFGL